MKYSLGAGLIATALFAGACNGADADASGGSSAIGSSGRLADNSGTSASSPGSGTGSSGPATSAPDPKQTCNADGIQWAVGQPATPDVVERLKREAGAKAVRVLPPGVSVTQEFMYGRLNVNVDTSNVITTLSCW
jgi:Peptidase inhibitor I78 family